MKRAGSEQKTRNNSVVVANTVDDTQAEDIISSLIFTAKRETFCTESQLFQWNQFFRNIGNKMDNKFRLVRVAERFVQEREKQGPTMEIMQQGGQSSRSTNALPCVQTRKFARKKAWDLHEHIYKV